MPFAPPNLLILLGGSGFESHSFRVQFVTWRRLQSRCNHSERKPQRVLLGIIGVKQGSRFLQRAAFMRCGGLSSAPQGI